MPNQISDLQIINYTQKSSANPYEEIVFIQSYKENWLKEFNAFIFDFSALINLEMKMKDGKMYRNSNNSSFIRFGFHDKDVDMDAPEIADLDNHPDYRDTTSFTASTPLKEGESFSAQYRIYDSALFLHKDFVYKTFISKETKEEESLFMKYSDSLKYYCKNTRNPIVVYDIEKVPGKEAANVNFENFTPEIKGIEYNKDHYFYTTNMKEMYNYVSMMDEEIQKGIEPGKMDLITFRESALRNFWMSMLTNGEYQKYDDIKFLLFIFGEILEPINIE